MLFCEYPFERPEDAEDAHRFTIVLERILNVQYEIPEGEQPRCWVYTAEATEASKL